MEVPVSVKRLISLLLPATVGNEIKCFALTDNHFKDPIDMDVVVCTSRSEVIEYKDRIPQRSLTLELQAQIKCIQIYRNSLNRPFYLVQSDDKLSIISACKKKLYLILNYNDIQSFEIVDRDAKGRASVYIMFKDDAMARNIDDIFEAPNTDYNEGCSDDSDCDTANGGVEFMNLLMRKYTEASFILEDNLEKYNYAKRLKIAATQISSEDNSLDPNSRLPSHSSGKEIAFPLVVPGSTFWMKHYNKTFVFGVEVANTSTSILPLNLQMDIYSYDSQSISYTTKIFSKVPQPPYWIPKDDHNFDANSKVTLVSVMTLDHFVYTSYLKYNLLVSYKEDEGSPIKTIGSKLICLKGVDVMNGLHDLTTKPDERHLLSHEDLLTLLSASQKTTVNLSYPPTNEPKIELPQVLQRELNMINISGDSSNLLVHDSKTDHPLQKILVLVQSGDCEDHNLLTIWYREKTQLMTLINLIYNLVPRRLIITSEKASAKLKTSVDDQGLDEKTIDHMDLTIDSQDVYKPSPKIQQLANELQRQMSTTIGYLNECIDLSKKDKNMDHLDLCVGGSDRFKKFKTELKERQVISNSILSEIN